MAMMCKEKVYKSIEEWEKEYLPTVVEEEKYKKLKDDPSCYGTILANKALERVRAQATSSIHSK